MEDRLSFLSKSKLELQRSLSTPPHERINNKHLMDMYIKRKRKKHSNRLSWHPRAIGSFTPPGSRPVVEKSDTRSLYIMSPVRDSVLMAGDSTLNLETGSNSGSNLTIHTIGLSMNKNISGHLLHKSFPSRPRTISVNSGASVSVLDMEFGPKHGEVSYHLPSFENCGSENLVHSILFTSISFFVKSLTPD